MQGRQSVTEAGVEEVQCPCCKLVYESKDPPSFPERKAPLHAHAGVCWDCVRHQNLTTDRGKFDRARKHGGMMRREYRRTRERVEAAHAELVEMQRELAMRPVQVVVRVENLDKYVVEHHLNEANEAHRRRDIAMGALSDVRVLHHKNPDDKVRCVCGVRYAQCRVAQLVDRWEGVLTWEQSHAGRAFKGHHHRLDREHPALKDPEYFDKIYGDA